MTEEEKPLKRVNTLEIFNDVLEETLDVNLDVKKYDDEKKEVTETLQKHEETQQTISSEDNTPISSKIENDHSKDPNYYYQMKPSKSTLDLWENLQEEMESPEPNKMPEESHKKIINKGFIDIKKTSSNIDIDDLLSKD
jgi:hypothetical protein